MFFDSDESYQGITLIDQLLLSPKLTGTILGVITRFRQEEAVVVAEVGAQQHQGADSCLILIIPITISHTQQGSGTMWHQVYDHKICSSSLLVLSLSQDIWMSGLKEANYGKLPQVYSHD